MKKFSLFLALALILALLPVCAMAESIVLGDTDGEVLDFDHFTITLQAGDVCQLSGEKNIGVIFATFYPAYDQNALTHPNMSVFWLDHEHMATMPTTPGDQQAFADSTAASSVQHVQEMGIPCSLISSTVLDPMTINGVEFNGICHKTLWDYTEYSNGALGEIQLTTYQLYTNLGEAGGYVFTLTAFDESHWDLFMGILNSFNLK